MIVKCPTCETKYKLDPAKFTSPDPKIRCKKCNNVFKAVDESSAAAAPVAEAAPPAKAAAPAPAPVASKPPTVAAPATAGGAGKPLVVIGHDSADVTEMASELLTEAGFEVIIASDGIQALLQIEQRRPRVAILDVGLPKMFGFEIVEVVRRDPALAGVKLMLIAAIYDKTRYKRNPQSLYGADDYIEKHMIPENLVAQVNALAGGENAPSEATATASVTATATSAPSAAPAAAAPAKAPVPAPKPAPAPAAAATSGLDESTLTPQEKEDHEKAKRLARIIASDIALYNADALVEGVKSGNPLQALERDIEEGRKLFVERVPANMRGKMDYIGIALEDLFTKKRKELGLAV